MIIQEYTEADASAWDAFTREAVNTTLLHTRKFLSYHGDRFKDKSLLIKDNKNKTIALLPAAQSPGDDSCIVSHPGVTFGGLITHRDCRGQVCLDIMMALLQHYKKLGYQRFQYKVVPHIYHKQPFQDDLYALFRLNGNRYRCDLSACIDLQNRGKISSRRKRGLKKAVKSDLVVQHGAQWIPKLWNVLEENLSRKHEAKPVHSIDEISLLHERFPDEIKFIVATKKEQCLAGVVLFLSPLVSHAQYISSSEEGYACSALDMVFDHCISQAKEGGRRYFDFGISNEEQGQVLNDGLYRFKTEFGAGSVLHEFYGINLQEL